MPFALLAPYRMPARDEDAELEALADHDGLVRALSRHRRRTIVGVVLGTASVLAVLLTGLAADDLVTLRRFRGAPPERVLAREAMVVPPRLAPSSAPAIRELDAPMAYVFFESDRIDTGLRID